MCFSHLFEIKNKKMLKQTCSQDFLCTITAVGPPKPQQGKNAMNINIYEEFSGFCCCCSDWRHSSTCWHVIPSWWQTYQLTGDKTIQKHTNILREESWGLHNIVFEQERSSVQKSAQLWARCWPVAEITRLFSSRFTSVPRDLYLLCYLV